MKLSLVKDVFVQLKKRSLDKVPVVIRELTEQQMMELAILENLQREDLTPIEEAEAYQMFNGKLKITQEELAKRLGKSQTTYCESCSSIITPC